MQTEEYLTHYDSMRSSRDSTRKELEEMTKLADSKQEQIEKMIKDLELKEKDRVANLVDAGTMTFMTMNSK